MQPQPNLDLNPTPTSTSTLRLPASPKHLAVGFVFSLTLGSASYPDIDLYRRITLAPINCVGTGSTCTVSVIRESPVPNLALDPLDALLSEVHGQISAEAWAKMPANFADDVDRAVYGA